MVQFIEKIFALNYNDNMEEREPSQEKQNKLSKKNSNLMADIATVTYCRLPNGNYDLTLAQNAKEKAFIETITKDPNRQSKKEEWQIGIANEAIGAKKAHNGYALLGGKLLLKKDIFVCRQIPADVDAITEEDPISGRRIAVSCKHTTSDGGQQDNIFKVMLNGSEQAPLKGNKLLLLYLLDGPFWTKERKSYKTHWRCESQSLITYLNRINENFNFKAMNSDQLLNSSMNSIYE